jgi:hypothetical protein
MRAAHSAGRAAITHVFLLPLLLLLLSSPVGKLAVPGFKDSAADLTLSGVVGLETEKGAHQGPNDVPRN